MKSPFLGFLVLLAASLSLSLSLTRVIAKEWRLGRQFGFYTDNDERLNPEP